MIVILSSFLPAHGHRRERRKSTSMDAYTDKVMTDGVFSRLTKPKQQRKEGEYDTRQKVLAKEFHVVRDAVPKWQSGL